MTLPLDVKTELQTEKVPISSEFSQSSSLPTEQHGYSTVSGDRPLLHSSTEMPRNSPKILWGAMLISSAIHLLMLFIPLPAEKPVSFSQAENRVNLTTLPQTKIITPAITAANLPAQVPVPNLNESLLPNASTNMRHAPTNTKLSPSNQSKSNAPLTSKKTSTSTKQTKPPKSPAKISQKNKKKPSLVVDSWQDFPSYPNVQIGCLKLPSCIRTDTDLPTASNFFEKELATKKYNFEVLVTQENQKVYKVSRNQRTEFLSFFLLPNAGTAYALSKKQLDINTILQAIERKTDGLVGNSGDPSNLEVSCNQFAKPNLFCINGVKRPEIETIEWVEGAGIDTIFDMYYRAALEDDGYEISSDQFYGEGPVYITEKDGNTLYINIVPNRDNTGAIIVTWTKLPQ